MLKREIVDFIKANSTSSQGYKSITFEKKQPVSEKELEELKYLEEYSDTVDLNRIKYKIRHKYNQNVLTSRDGYMGAKLISTFYFDKKGNLIFVKKESLKYNYNNEEMYP